MVEDDHDDGDDDDDDGYIKPTKTGLDAVTSNFDDTGQVGRDG